MCTGNYIGCVHKSGRIVHKTGTGEVGKKNTERDRNEQKRLALLGDGKIQKNAGNKKHHKVLPVENTAGKKGVDSRSLPQTDKDIFNHFHLENLLSFLRLNDRKNVVCVYG